MKGHEIHTGSVYHSRVGKDRNRFRYGFYFFDFDLEDLCLERRGILGVQNTGLLSLYSQDHLQDREGRLKDLALEMAKQFRLDTEGVRLRLITLPRFAGFVFNPVSFFLATRGEELSWAMVEVHNYHGGRVLYPVSLQFENGFYCGSVRKDFYVSPFLPEEGRYHFRFRYGKGTFQAHIDFQSPGEELRSGFQGITSPMTPLTIAGVIFRHPLLHLLIPALTVYQAVKLYLKGIKPHSPVERDRHHRNPEEDVEALNEERQTQPVAGQVK